MTRRIFLDTNVVIDYLSKRMPFAISQAIQSDFSDFEDAVQYHTALSGNIDAIITRNPKDYINSAIPVYTPSEFIQVPYWAEDTNKTVLNEPDLNQLRTRKS